MDEKQDGGPMDESELKWHDMDVNKMEDDQTTEPTTNWTKLNGLGDQVSLHFKQ